LSTLKKWTGLHLHIVGHNGLLCKARKATVQWKKHRSRAIQNTTGFKSGDAIAGGGGGGEREGEQQFIAFTYEWDVIKH
jgi:hypothetical protein